MKTFRIESQIEDGDVWYYAEQLINGNWVIPENPNNTLCHIVWEEFEVVKWWGLIKYISYKPLPPKRLGFKNKEFLETLIEHEHTGCPLGIFWHDWHKDLTKVLE
jgi:hypothetical protein